MPTTVGNSSNISAEMLEYSNSFPSLEGFFSFVTYCLLGGIMKEVLFPLSSTIYLIQRELGVTVYEDPKYHYLGGFVHSREEPCSYIIVREGKETNRTVLHELTHALQFCPLVDGESPLFHFNSTSMKEYLATKGIPFSSEDASIVHWAIRNFTEEGVYTPDEYQREFPAFYIKQNTHGERILLAMLEDVKPLLARKDSLKNVVKRAIITKLLKIPIWLLLIIAF
jgi:hypothetical protein